jgi:hypothetical protein
MAEEPGNIRPIASCGILWRSSTILNVRQLFKNFQFDFLEAK